MGQGAEIRHADAAGFFVLFFKPRNMICYCVTSVRFVEERILWLKDNLKARTRICYSLVLKPENNR